MGKNKVLIDINVLVEVDEDKLAKALDKIIAVLSKELKCGAIRTNKIYDDKIRVDAEFCHPLMVKKDLV